MIENFEWIIFAVGIIAIIIWILTKKSNKPWILFRKETISTNGISSSCIWGWNKYTGATTGCYSRPEELMRALGKR